jgi:hypothetical protein
MHGHETLTLRLPPKALVDRSEAMLKGTSYENPEDAELNFEGESPLDYPLPAFYKQFADLGGLEPQAQTQGGNDLRPATADNVSFHHKRIGEYTVNSCI